MKINNKSKNEFFIALLCSVLGLHFYVGTFLEFQNIDTSIITRFVYAFIMLLGSCILLKCFFQKPLNAVVFLLLVFIFAGLDILRNIGNLEYVKIDNILSLFFIFVPLFLSFLNGIKFGNFLKYISFWSRIMLTIMSFVFAYIMFYKKAMMPEYMSFAYYSIPPIIFMWSSKKRLYDYILLFVSSVFVLITGCRGALLLLLVFYCLLFFYKSDGRFSKKGRLQKRLTNAFKIVLVVLAAFVFVNLRPILLSITSLLGDYGSRTINLALSDDGFFSSSSRLSIWSSAIEQINLTGYGPIGYRNVINVGYVHNIILELMLSYGCIVGVVFIVLIFYFVLSNFFSAKNRFVFSKYVICSGSLSMLFIKFMLSDSFLFSIDFWLFFGLSVSLAIQGKRKINASNRRLINGCSCFELQ